MGVGSQRVALEHPEAVESFQVRKFAPNSLLFANLGAVQLNYGYGIDECQRAVDMIEADALILHLNALQEAVQPEGDTLFAGLLQKIEKVCKTLPVPVIAKEVGWGFSAEAARMLASAGVKAIDIAGAGGTSWSQVEMHRATNESQARLAAAFLDWGIPTAEFDLAGAPGCSGIDHLCFRRFALGCRYCEMYRTGRPPGRYGEPVFTRCGRIPEATILAIDELSREIRICMFATGTNKLDELSPAKLTRIS